MQSKRRKLAIMGLVGSMGLGVALAFVLDLRNRALRTASQFERATQIRPVISIPPLGKPPRRPKGPTLHKGVAIASGLGAMVLSVAGLAFAAARTSLGRLAHGAQGQKRRMISRKAGPKRSAFCGPMP
jgi:hypothetical protein